MGRVFALVLVACAAGCYQSPSVTSCKYRCGGANNDACPSGFQCNAGMCVAPGESCDGDGGVIDAPDDGSVDMMIDAPPCPDPNVHYWSTAPGFMIGNNVEQIAAFDANNDGKVDLAVLDDTSSLGMYRGNGDGTFMARVPASFGPGAKKIATGDFDGDGQRDDIMVLRSNELVTLIYTSNENFTPRTFALSGSAIDFGNAGNVDMASGDDVIVLLGGGSPTLQVYLQAAMNPYWTATASASTNTAANGVFVGRANADGVTDVIVRENNLNQMVLHVGMGMTSMYTLSGNNTVSAATAADVVAGRLQASGMPSIVSVNTANDAVTINLFNGVMSVDNGESVTVGDAPKALVLADVVGSPLLDIVTADSGGDQISILRNDGAFTPGTPLMTDDNPVDLVAADFDGNGFQDLAVASAGAHTVDVFLNRCIP